VVTLARPEAHNALGYEGWKRLAKLFNAFATERRLRVVVIRGGGERSFSAGADIREFPKRRATADRAQIYNGAVAEALSAVMACSVPVLAMIRGLAVGGGCELAAACDLRIAAEDARLGIPIGRLGVTLGATEARALVRLIGSARLKDLLFTGRLLDAQEAAAIGLLDRVVPVERLTDVIVEMAQTIASAARVTIRAAKLVANLEGAPPTRAEKAELMALDARAYGGEDLHEGIEAFLNRRPPRFTQ
jgi:enoyl-CoA hydratase